MKPFAASFYKSKAWQSCRNEYIKSAHYLCENCLRQGIYRPAEIVHHKIEIDPVTIEIPEISLNFDNLEALCRKCHAERHPAGRRTVKRLQRYMVGEGGKVTPAQERTESPQSDGNG